MKRLIYKGQDDYTIFYNIYKKTEKKPIPYNGKKTNNNKITP